MKKNLMCYFVYIRGNQQKNNFDEIGVGNQTVLDWNKCRKEIENFYHNMVAKDSLGNKATIRTTNNSQRNKAYFVKSREHLRSLATTEGLKLWVLTN